MHMYELWTIKIHLRWSVLKLEVHTLTVRFTADDPNNSGHPFRLSSQKKKKKEDWCMKGFQTSLWLSQYQTSKLLQARVNSSTLALWTCSEDDVLSQTPGQDSQLWTISDYSLIHSELAQKMMYLAKHQDKTVSCEQSVITV